MPLDCSRKILTETNAIRLTLSMLATQWKLSYEKPRRASDMSTKRVSIIALKVLNVAWLQSISGRNLNTVHFLDSKLYARNTLSRGIIGVISNCRIAMYYRTTRFHCCEMEMLYGTKNVGCYVENKKKTINL